MIGEGVLLMKDQKIPFLAYRSFYTPLNTIEKFANAGYETICVFPAHTVNSRGTPYSQYGPVWKWLDRLDFAPFDQMIYDITRAMPEARFLLMIDLNSPVWLEHYFYHESADSFNNLGKTVHNANWKELTSAYLRSFLKYAKEKYGERILAYILACGATDEWYDYSEGAEDAARTEAWRKYCLERGMDDPVDVPARSCRNHITHFGFLRDPEQDKMALEYWKFCNRSIADCIMHFASEARSVIGDSAQLGCFYGYILEKSWKSLVSCGHLDYERAMECPDLDFFISPGTYTDRKIGGGSGFLIPCGSAEIRGKRLLHECDQRTHTNNPYLTPDIQLRVSNAWENERSTVAGLKREAALGLIHRTHLWWFDMWGDFYQGEAVMETLRRIQELWKEYASLPAEDVCETALVVDAESTYLLDQDHPVTPKIHLGTRNKLNRLGAPFKVYSFSDIPRIRELSRYKLVIFSSLFLLTEEKKRILKEYLCKENRTVLFLGPAGIFNDGKYDPECCCALTGAQYPAPGVTTVHHPDWKSISVHDYDCLTPNLLREAASEAGVTLYAEKEIPVYAEGDLFAVHSQEGGITTLHVPRRSGTVTELFTGKVCTVADGKFQYEFATPDTGLFHFS